MNRRNFISGRKHRPALLSSYVSKGVPGVHCGVARMVLAAVLIMSLVAQDAFAQRYHARTYSLEDGLPQSMVHARVAIEAFYTG